MVGDVWERGEKFKKGNSLEISSFIYVYESINSTIDGFNSEKKKIEAGVLDGRLLNPKAGEESVRIYQSYWDVINDFSFCEFAN